MFGKPEAHLLAHDGDGRPGQLLRTVQEMIQHVLWEPLQDKPPLENRGMLDSYLRGSMGAMDIEEFRVLFLDARLRLIRDEVMWRGSVSETPIIVREVAKRAIELGASALIAIHNHPSTDAAPSKQDKNITRELSQALTCLTVRLADHLIVTRNEVCSFRALGLL